MVCVDFCDAIAFCKWAGKRLCGSLDAPKNTLLESDELVEVAASIRFEWADACTQGGKTKWPYGFCADLE